MNRTSPKPATETFPKLRPPRRTPPFSTREAPLRGGGGAAPAAPLAPRSRPPRGAAPTEGSTPAPAAPRSPAAATPRGERRGTRRGGSACPTALATAPRGAGGPGERWQRSTRKVDQTPRASKVAQGFPKRCSGAAESQPGNDPTECVHLDLGGARPRPRSDLEPALKRPQNDPLSTTDLGCAWGVPLPIERV